MKTVLSEHAPRKLPGHSLNTFIYIVAWAMLFYVVVSWGSHQGGPVALILAVIVFAAALLHGTRRNFFARCPECGRAMQFVREVYVVEQVPYRDSRYMRTPWGVVRCVPCDASWRVPWMDTEPDNESLMTAEAYGEVVRQRLCVNSAGGIEQMDAGDCATENIEKA